MSTEGTGLDREARKHLAFARLHARRAKELLDDGGNTALQDVVAHALTSLALTFAYCDLEDED